MITVNTREDFLKELSKLLPENSRGVEIGVLHGDFSKMILDIINPRCLFLIDPYITDPTKRYVPDGLPTAYSTQEDYENLLKRFEKEISVVKVVVLRAMSYESARNMNNGWFDFFYLDGSHLYEDGKRDLNDWMPKVKDDGVIAGHDYTDEPAFGIKQAVNEFMEEHNYEMVIYNENGGDFSLKKKQ